MIRHLLLLTLGIAAVGAQNDTENFCVLGGEEFQFCTCDQFDFSIYWNVNEVDATVDIAFDVPDNGWHSLGFSSEPANGLPMPGSNAVFGCAAFVDEEGADRLETVDYFLAGRSESNVNPAGNQDLIAFTQVQADGRCTIRFERAMEVPGLDEEQNLVNASRTVVLASGGADFARHTSRGAFMMNFITGEGADAASCEVSPEDDGDGMGASDCVLNGESFDFCLFDVLDFEIYWNVLADDSTLDIAFDVPANGWHSMGFSSRAVDDEPMLGSNAIFGCADFVDLTDPEFEEIDYNLGQKSIAAVVPQGNQDLVDHTQVIADGRCTVRFERPIAPPMLDAMQHLVDDMRTVVVANGGDDFNIHSQRAALSVNFIGGQALDVVNMLDPVRVAHGAMMAIAFGFCFPFGILSARHKKIIYGGRKRWGKQLWFHVHRSLMPLGALLSTASFIMILITERAFYAETEHLAIGVVTMFLIYVQLSFVRIRPRGPKKGEKMSPERRKWNLAHWWNGRLAATFAFANTAFGFFILNPPIGYTIFFFVVSGLIFLTYVTLELVQIFGAEPKTEPKPVKSMDSDTAKDGYSEPPESDGGSAKTAASAPEVAMEVIPASKAKGSSESSKSKHTPVKTSDADSDVDV